MKSTLHRELADAPAFEKLALVDHLLASIGDLEVAPEYHRELKRRAAEITANPAIGRTWSQVKAGKRKTR